MCSNRLRPHPRDEGFAVLLLGFAVLFLGQHLLVLETRVPRVDHNIGLEVQHPLELAHGHVEEETDTRG